MRHKKKERLECRVYEVPRGESVLVLQGEDWIGSYGSKDQYRHFHNLFEIGYCVSGRGLLILGDDELVYEGGMLSAIPSNYPHITVSEGIDAWEYLFFDAEELICEMFPGQPKYQGEKLAKMNEGAFLVSADEEPEFASSVRGILQEMKGHQPYYRENVRHLMKVCLMMLIRIGERKTDGHKILIPDASSRMEKILPALRYIEAHYSETVPASLLAQHCGLSEVHFRRLFDDCMHMPPIDYLNSVRIQKACRLMGKRDLPMDAVAEASGFSSLSAFTRNFKKYMHTTPYKWMLDENNYECHLRQFEVSTHPGWKEL